MIKYILPILIISISISVPFFTTIAADDGGGGGGGGGGNSNSSTNVLNIENPLGTTSDITTLVKNILNFLWKLAWVIAPILVVYAGFLYITSAGNEEKVKTAQKTLIWALVGFAVVLIASSVPAVIRDFLSGEEESSESGDGGGGSGETEVETQEQSENNDSDISPIGEFPDEFYEDVLQYSD